MVGMICLVAVLVGSAVAPSMASELSQKVAERHADVYKSRAREVAVWAIPMMNFKALRDGYFDNGAAYNTVNYFSKMQDSRFQPVPPYDTIPYLPPFFNLQKGPVVVDVPAASKQVMLFGTFIDSLV